jgi:hypothetical protein
MSYMIILSAFSLYKNHQILFVSNIEINYRAIYKFKKFGYSWFLKALSRKR